jgi:hypothetical protein
MTDKNWNKYHESKDELIIALEKHLKNIDLVHVYDNKIMTAITKPTKNI